MKKFYTILASVLAFVASMNAQNESVLEQIVTPEGRIFTPTYNNKGQLEKVVEVESGEINTTFTHDFSYSDHEIVQLVNAENASGKVKRVANTAQGRINSEILDIVFYDEGNKERLTYQYLYNSNNQLIEVVIEGKEQGTIAWTMEWEDDNITKMIQRQNGEVVGEALIGYSELLNNKYINMVWNPLLQAVSDEMVMPYGQMYGAYYGIPTKNIFNSLKYIVYNGEKVDYSDDDNMNIGYKQNAEGNIIEIVNNESNSTMAYLKWAKPTTGVEQISPENNNVITYYDLQGRQAKPNAKGLLIVKQHNGKNKKVLKL